MEGQKMTLETKLNYNSKFESKIGKTYELSDIKPLDGTTKQEYSKLNNMIEKYTAQVKDFENENVPYKNIPVKLRKTLETVRVIPTASKHLANRVKVFEKGIYSLKSIQDRQNDLMKDYATKVNNASKMINNAGYNIQVLKNIEDNMSNKIPDLTEIVKNAEDQKERMDAQEELGKLDIDRMSIGIDIKKYSNSILIANDEKIWYSRHKTKLEKGIVDLQNIISRSERSVAMIKRHILDDNNPLQIYMSIKDAAVSAEEMANAHEKLDGLNEIPLSDFGEIIQLPEISEEDNEKNLIANSRIELEAQKIYENNLQIN